MSDKKRISDMSFEEQIAYYQKKAAAVKAKMVKEANARYQLIGKTVSEIFTDLPTNDAELQAYFTNVFEAYRAEAEDAENTTLEYSTYPQNAGYQNTTGEAVHAQGGQGA